MFKDKTEAAQENREADFFVHWGQSSSTFPSSPPRPHGLRYTLDDIGIHDELRQEHHLLDGLGKGHDSLVTKRRVSFLTPFGLQTLQSNGLQLTSSNFPSTLQLLRDASCSSRSKLQNSHFSKSPELALEGSILRARDCDDLRVSTVDFEEKFTRPQGRADEAEETVAVNFLRQITHKYPRLRASAAASFPSRGFTYRRQSSLQSPIQCSAQSPSQGSLYSLRSSSRIAPGQVSSDMSLGEEFSYGAWSQSPPMFPRSEAHSISNPSSDLRVFLTPLRHSDPRLDRDFMAALLQYFSLSPRDMWGRAASSNDCEGRWRQRNVIGTGDGGTLYNVDVWEAYEKKWENVRQSPLELEVLNPSPEMWRETQHSLSTSGISFDAEPPLCPLRSIRIQRQLYSHIKGYEAGLQSRAVSDSSQDRFSEKRRIQGVFRRWLEHVLELLINDNVRKECREGEGRSTNPVKRNGIVILNDILAKSDGRLASLFASFFRSLPSEGTLTIAENCRAGEAIHEDSRRSVAAIETLTHVVQKTLPPDLCIHDLEAIMLTFDSTETLYPDPEAKSHEGGKQGLESGSNESERSPTSMKEKRWGRRRIRSVRVITESSFLDRILTLPFNLPDFPQPPYPHPALTPAAKSTLQSRRLSVACDTAARIGGAFGGPHQIGSSSSSAPGCRVLTGQDFTSSGLASLEEIHRTLALLHPQTPILLEDVRNALRLMAALCTYHLNPTECLGFLSGEALECYIPLSTLHLRFLAKPLPLLSKTQASSLGPKSGLNTRQLQRSFLLLESESSSSALDALMRRTSPQLATSRIEERRNRPNGYDVERDDPGLEEIASHGIPIQRLVSLARMHMHLKDHLMT